MPVSKRNSAMKRAEIAGRTGRSDILVGESLKNLPQYVPTDRAVIVTDSRVAALYRKDFPSWPVVVVGTGEGAKTLDTVCDIYRAFLELEVDRDTFVVGIGGGIVCDVAGFSASTYFRGLPFGFVATTLLAQVDAGLGGKNGVNFGGFKNMVGLFNQPRFVLCDPLTLQTLAGREIACGLAEVVKHALIADRQAFEFIERHASEILACDPIVMEKMIFDAVAVKAAIVNQDELEQGTRRKLNFGHTVGHAVEAVTGVPHGEAVAQGMAAAASLSVRRGLLAASEAARILGLLKKLGLPVAVEGNREAIVNAMRRDKKRSGDLVRMVLLEAIGSAVVVEIGLGELKEAFGRPR